MTSSSPGLGQLTCLIFILAKRATLFGCARLTPRDMVRNNHANFTLEWVRHNIYLCDKDLKTATELNEGVPNRLA